MGVVAGRPRRPGDPTSAYFLQFPMVSPHSSAAPLFHCKTRSFSFVSLMTRRRRREGSVEKVICSIDPLREKRGATCTQLPDLHSRALGTALPTQSAAPLEHL